MRKIKHLILAVLFLSTANNIHGQNSEKVIIYANKSDFLLPFIVTTIDHLTNSQNSNRLFEKVTNLNLLFANTEADKLLRRNLDYIFPLKSFGGNLKNEYSDSLLNVFVNNDLFLLVNQNTLQDKIEFQLTLYRISKDKIAVTEANALTSFPLKNILSPVAENNFFINLNSENYLSSLRNGVKKLFPSSNYVPKFKIEVSGNIIKKANNKYEASLYDSIRVDLVDIVDSDNDAANISFKLHQLVEGKSDILRNIKRENNDFERGISIKYETPGFRKLYIEIDDGIAVSNSDTIEINVLDLSRIYVLKTEIKLPLQLSVFSLEKLGPLKIPIITDGDSKYIFSSSLTNTLATRKEVITDSIASVIGKRIITTTQEDKGRISLVSVRNLPPESNFKIMLQGRLNDLTSNYDSVIVSVYPMNPLHVSANFLYTNIDFKKGSSIINSSAVFTPAFCVKFNAFNYRGVEFGVEQYWGKVINTESTNRSIEGIKSFNGLFIKAGIFISNVSMYTAGNLLVTTQLGLNMSQYPFTLDTTVRPNILRDYSAVLSYGGDLTFNIASPAYRGIGISFGLYIGGGKLESYSILSTGLKFGIQINPILSKKRFVTYSKSRSAESIFDKKKRR